MQQLTQNRITQNRARSRAGRVLARIAATLLLAAAVCHPDLAHAAPHGGGGGFHGGGFGGFHGGGFHGGFAGLHNGFGQANGGRWDHGWHNGGLGWTSYPYYWSGYQDYGYYDYNQPYASQYWYYCSDPAGYYPYVTQCNTTWQTVPAS